MIFDVHRKPKDGPEERYTIAACDICEAMCPGSRLPGRRGVQAAIDADALALQQGWIHRDATVRRGKKFDVIAKLLCPRCAAKCEPEAST